MTTEPSAERANRILDILATGGAQAYFGEPVTQLEHALQTAALADECQAPDPLIIAALLHELGHLLHGFHEDIARLGVDAKHEEAAHLWLAGQFGSAVIEPIRLHVLAKRYLCHVDPSYAASLSPASMESLSLQGGPMTREQAAAFELTPWASEATTLRRWDDAAKVAGKIVPGLAYHRPRLQQLLEAS